MSSARLGPYRAITRDDDHAWALYRWNLGLVAALVPLSSDFEVALRNTIHDQLSAHFRRADWWASHELILDDARPRRSPPSCADTSASSHGVRSARARSSPI